VSIKSVGRSFIQYINIKLINKLKLHKKLSNHLNWYNSVDLKAETNHLTITLKKFN